MENEDYIRFEREIKCLEELVESYRVLNRMNDELIKTQTRYISVLEETIERLLVENAVLKKGSN